MTETAPATDRGGSILKWCIMGAKVQRLVKPWAVLSSEIVSAMEHTRPFAVALLGCAGCAASFTAASAREAEAYAVDELAKDAGLFGAVVWCDKIAGPVSRVLPV